jgi:hypothetical protein
MKHRIVHTLQKYVLNPPIKLALAIGLPFPGYGLMRCPKRKDGRRASQGGHLWAMDVLATSAG